MFSRLTGVSRVARTYSTAQKNDSALFLSDLMKRIDNINAKTKKIAELKKQPSAPTSKAGSPKKAGAVKKTQDAAKAAPATRAPRSNFRQEKKITIKDHPLSRNTFKLMDEANFKKTDRAPARRSGAPRSGNPPSRNAESRLAAGPGQKARPQRPKRVDLAKKGPAVERIVLKDLVVKDYRPSIGGDDFFYGKPATLATSLTSRVAAVAKEALLESKYPYKLPKSIIDKLDSSFAGNKFILQKDFNLDVDATKFGDRINKVVRGQVDTIELGKNPEATSVFTANQLARNGDLTIAQQQTIYDVASGLKSAKLLLEGAVWNK